MRFIKPDTKIGRVNVILDLEDLDFEQRATIEPYLKFEIPTYSVLKLNSSMQDFNTVFGPVHAVLDLMSKEQQASYALMLASMHKALIERMINQAVVQEYEWVRLETDISKAYLEFDQYAKLWDKALAVSRTQIPIHMFDNVGERPQDSGSMTFYKNDVERLTAVSIICKTLTPILGVFIMESKNKLDPINKESHCASLLKDIFEYNDAPIIEKITNYLSNILKNCTTTMTSAMQGITSEVINIDTTSSIFIRKLVTVDLYKEHGNLLTYIVSSARAALSTQYNEASQPRACKDFKRPNESTTEENNDSNFEAESRNSTKPANFMAKIAFAARDAYRRFIRDNELDRSLCDQTYEYYCYKPVMVTPINKYVMSLVFGDYLGGAKSIDYLESPAYNQLLAALQVYLIGQGYINLANAITAESKVTSKVSLTQEEIQLNINWANSVEYRNVDAKLDMSINDISWNTGLAKIKDHMVKYRILYNTAPAIWDHIKVENINNTVFTPVHTVPKEICSLIGDLYQ